jgi:hypothetical protein
MALCSFWAFEKLAHPLYGTQMLDFRPVDCYTKQPFTTFLPGFVNETIYGDRVESGWSYNVYASNQNQFSLEVRHLHLPYYTTPYYTGEFRYAGQ